MTRTVDERHKDELLDRVLGYVLTNGIRDLSLRPLARAVGSSPRGLLYHFSSKEELVVRVLERMRERQRATFLAMRSRTELTPVELCRAAWKEISSRKYLGAYRLLFETFAMALQDPKRYSVFVRGAIDEWIAFLGYPIERDGGSKEQARTFGTIVLAGFRGFLMDLVATGARRRIDKAVDRWIDAIKSMTL